MIVRERASAEPIRELLRRAAPEKEAELADVFKHLNPQCELDHDAEHLLFEAVPYENLIRIGMKCTIRLQAHSYGAGAILAAFATPGYERMSEEERSPLLKPADTFFNWAVSRDLQQWVGQISGSKPELHEIWRGAEKELPADILSTLNDAQRKLGGIIFTFASAFVLLHELGHLECRHQPCRGDAALRQEREADLFAARWLLESASHGNNRRTSRVGSLLGVSVGLLWLTVFNVFLGDSTSSTHPEGYERLSQVLDAVIDPNDKDEQELVWNFISLMLFMHMEAAGFDSDETDSVHMQTDCRSEARYLVNRIANQDRKR